MEYILAQYATGAMCQLMQAGHIILGFLYVLLMAITVVLGFVFDVVTWFTLHLYQYYLPWMIKAFRFLTDGLNGYTC
ncbi:MAG: hypothetical protein J0L53_08730 [Spirochaetes bacterium]|nr:hypothetical protein [Spirochaetota bacterium]MBX3721696.1 hypothetical protein [Turneriella sp.]